MKRNESSVEYFYWQRTLKKCRQIPKQWKFIKINLYSSLSNNRAGCNKRADWKNLQKLGGFKSQIEFKTHLRLF